MKTISVQVQPDHLEKIAYGRRPVPALAELIWNALDADAHRVNVSIRRDFTGGVEEISVADDGTGITVLDADEGFGSLGGSWKRVNTRTRRDKRMLHGREGKGRLQAFSLGTEVEWETCYERTGGVRETLTIIGSAERLGTFTVSDPKPAPASTPTGTTVLITGIRESVWGLSGRVVAGELAEVLAIYLRQYPAVVVSVDGEVVDPSQLEAYRAEYQLEPIEVKGSVITDAKLTVVEWNTTTTRTLYLCNRDGFAMHSLLAGIQAPGYNFTAYLSSDYLSGLAEDQGYLVGELDPGIAALSEAARRRMRDHFRQRRAAEAAEVVDTWKRENIYPYEGDPGSVVERTSREVFDVVAASINTHLRDFADADRRTKQFSLRLLRQAMETNPESLQRIITDVLHLPKSKQDELAELLEKTSLSAIISAAKVVADRLNVLRALEAMIYEPEPKKQMLERTQLHRILVDHTWIFGEEYNLSVDDESLTAVLNKHLSTLGRDQIAQEPVLRTDGTVGIVDVMLSRRIPQPKAEEREHLIIELKRPSQVVNRSVIGQVEDYALAVANDERFRGTNTRWIFWAISNDMDEYAKSRGRQADRPRGMISRTEEPHIDVWVKTWSEVFEDCRSRLTFFMQQLNYSADRDNALEHLRTTHGHYFPKALQGQTVVDS